MLDAPNLTEQELTERIHWLIRLRWLAAASVLAAAAVLYWWQSAAGPAMRTFITGLMIAAYNAGFIAYGQVLESGDTAISARSAARFANLQIAVDLFALTALLHFTGGAMNPFAFFFVFHMIIAGILLPPVAAYAQATWALVLYGSMVFLEGAGLISHTPIALFGRSFLNVDASPLITVGVLGLTLYLSVWMATSITVRLRQREREAAELMMQIQEKADELGRAYTELEETQQLQTQYMQRVAHELRAPLGAIASLLSVVSEGLTGQVPPKQRELVQRAEAKIAELLRLVNDLLTLTRSRHGALSDQIEPVNLSDVIQSVAGLHKARADSKRVTLAVEVPDLLPPVRGDAEGLTQVMTNLTANAIKYTPEGGSATITATQEGDEIVVRVRDTGIGIPAEELPRIFDEFYRATDARRFQRVGTGLGLSIARSIVDAHGGTLTAESQVGVGTTFTLRLPAYCGPGSPCEKKRPPQSAT